MKILMKSYRGGNHKNYFPTLYLPLNNLMIYIPIDINTTAVETINILKIKSPYGPKTS